MATIHRVFQFPDGQVDRDTIRREEHYGHRHDEERNEVRFVAREGESFVNDDPDQIELHFYPD